MDTSEYLPMFLAECRENLQELNLAVVRIEEAPDERDTVDEIFRIAHSLKGMSATMGFERMASLTHKMEDVFELLRQRTGGLSREAIDVLFQCLDALSDSVETIEAVGAEDLDPAALIARLEGLLREQDVTVEDPVTAVLVRPSAEAVDGRRLVHVRAELAADVAMPSVRAYMVLAALAEHGEVLSAVPDDAHLEDFGGQTVMAWITSDHESDVIAAAVRDVPDVAQASVSEDPDEEAAALEPSGQDAAGKPAAGDGAADPAPADAVPGAPSARKGAGSTGTVRVDAERLDQLMHYMGELVVHRTHVEALAAQADVPGLAQAMQELTRSSHALQSMVMQVRMIPVEAVFLRFPRLVRDLSSRLGKLVDLQLIGQETELDRTVVDALGDPLVHLVRNSLDHGLESAEDRVAAGKEPMGTLEISARHAGGNVVIDVRDDGRGIDPRKIAAKAVERGLITPEAADAVDAQRAAELLFAPGFSTADTTSDISGRGVGMDAVRTKIRELGGEVVIHSELGSGTTAQIRLPLTLAIMSALLVEASDMPFAIPLDRVERALRLEEATVRSVAGRRMLVMGDGVLPLLDAAAALGHADSGADQHVVIVRGQDTRVALAVTRLVGQRELVTRPLPSGLADGRAVSGAAVLSNGAIALLVDCDALMTTGANARTALPAAAA